MFIENMKIPFRLFVGFFLLIFLSCEDGMPSDSDGSSIADVMSDVVTKIYSEGAEDDFSSKSQDDVLAWFTDAEKNVLGSKYWNFKVNQPVEVYIAQDETQKEDPFWLIENVFQKT